MNDGYYLPVCTSETADKKRVSGVILSFSTVCNYQCPFCCTNGYLIGKQFNLPVKKDVIDWFCNNYEFDFVKFTGTGETVLTPNFDEIFFYTLGKEEVKNVILYTNGVQRSQEYWINFIQKCSRYSCDVEILFSLKAEYDDSIWYFNTLLKRLENEHYSNVRVRLIAVINDFNLNKWIGLSRSSPQLVERLVKEETGYFEVDKIHPANFERISEHFTNLKHAYDSHYEVIDLIGYEARDMNCLEITRTVGGLLAMITAKGEEGGVMKKDLRLLYTKVEELDSSPLKPYFRKG